MTQIIEIEPGWLLFSFRGPKPPVHKRAFFLHKALTEWLAKHPGRSSTRTLAVQHEGALQGVHVWLDSAEKLSRRQVAVKMRKSLSGKIHPEHLEAFLNEAYRIFFQEHQGASALAVINRSGLALLFDHDGEQGYLMPAEELAVDQAAKDRIVKWLAKPGSNFYIMDITGFRPPPTEPGGSEGENE